jgi:RNA recognition motif-containing protein
MNIYVSNIPYTASDENLLEAFSAFGTVQSARIIKDRMTGRSRGFGFVEMANDEEARKALEGLNGTEMQGRRINAREARPREENGRPGNGGDRGGIRSSNSGGRPQVITRGVY